MNQKVQSSQEAPFHKTDSPHIFYFGAEFNHKHATVPSTSVAVGLGNNSVFGSSIPLGSVSSEKGDGKEGQGRKTGASKIGQFFEREK